MNNLIKALKCRELWFENECGLKCAECEYNQDEYVDMAGVCNKAAIELVRLDKSNKNWRRKVQRLRHELKEVKKNGVP